MAPPGVLVALVALSVLLALPAMSAAQGGSSRADPRPAPSSVASSVVARIGTLHDAGALREADAASLDAIAAARLAHDTATERALTLRHALVLADQGRLADAFAAVLPLAGGSPADLRDVRATLAALHLRRQAGQAALEALPPTTSDPASAADANDDASRPMTGLPPPTVLRGLALVASGEAEAGAALLRRWLSSAGSTPGDSAGTIDAHLGIARAALALGDLDAAHTHADVASTHASRAGHRLRLADAQLLLGRWARLTGDTTAADGAMRTALAIASAAPLPRVAAPAAHALYESAAARGADGEALELLRIHTDARLALASEAETQRLVDVLSRTLPDGTPLRAGVGVGVGAGVGTGGAAATEPGAATESSGRSGAEGGDVVRMALLGASLSSLVLAAVLWRVGYTRGRRLLHYRQELEALKGTVTNVGALDGLITICASCKDVCTDDGDWTRVEAYLAARTDARFTHSICPTCEQRVLAGAGLTDSDVDESDGATPEAATRPHLQGGFDWPPSEDELARVLEAAERAPEGPAASRGGRWG